MEETLTEQLEIAMKHLTWLARDSRKYAGTDAQWSASRALREIEALRSVETKPSWEPTVSNLRAKLAAKSEAYGRLIAEIEELTSAISSSRVVCIESATFYEFRVATKWVDKLEKRIEEFRVVDQSCG